MINKIGKCDKHDEVDRSRTGSRSESDINTEIDWIIETVMKIKDKLAYKNEIRKVIK